MARLLVGRVEVGLKGKIKCRAWDVLESTLRTRGDVLTSDHQGNGLEAQEDVSYLFEIEAGGGKWRICLSISMESGI